MQSSAKTPEHSSEKQHSSETEKKSKKVKIRLRTSLIMTINDILDFYLEGKLDDKWKQSPHILKETVNGIGQAIRLGYFFNTVKLDRKTFCDQLKKDLQSTDIRSLCAVAIKLGSEAELAYSSTTYSYSIFFYLGHAIRNILVRELAKEFHKEYYHYIQDLNSQLETLQKNIENYFEKKIDASGLIDQRDTFNKQLTFLELNKAVWETKRNYDQYIRPDLLPKQASDDPNKPFIFQPDYGPTFINSAYTSVMGCPFEKYIDKKELEVPKVKTHKNNQ